jgi:hypothetical protein
MKQFFMLFSFMLSMSLISAQTSLPPTKIEISTPISGYVAISALDTDTEDLKVFDTEIGNEIAQNKMLPSGLTPYFWDKDGKNFFYGNGVYNLDTNTISTLQKESLPEISLEGSTVMSPGGWSSNSNKALITVNLDLITSYLAFYDVISGQFARVSPNLSRATPAIDYGVPSANAQQNLVILGWWDNVLNPIYDNWVVSKAAGLDLAQPDPNDSTAYLNVFVHYLWNLETNQTISLDTQMPNQLGSYITPVWSKDGKWLAIQSYSPQGYATLYIFSFDPVNGVTLIEKATIINSNNTAGIQAFLTQDIFVTSKSNGLDYYDHEIQIAQIIGESIYYKSFLNVISATGYMAFHFTFDDTEKATLSCMFEEHYALPTQLTLNSRARVTLNGMSSRLRDNHSTNGNIITELAPGTEFTIISGSYCAEDYRWWQIQLDDGTIGWTVEDDAQEYFTEPTSGN